MYEQLQEAGLISQEQAKTERMKRLLREISYARMGKSKVVWISAKELKHARKEPVPAGS